MKTLMHGAMFMQVTLDSLEVGLAKELTVHMVVSVETVAVETVVVKTLWGLA